MRKGLLTAWNNAKGFGFITPESGGERVFAHISGYAGRGRPVSNNKVTFSGTQFLPPVLITCQAQKCGAGLVGGQNGKYCKDI
ncbi:cold-shock protein [Marinobacter caseinilyticus]|uniref:cold-shock protein n=1 Tax=Marinobacter caseinilyticus TaxID=2692195 RepID=UPI001408922C|nr:cold shock domain-containing protein [Marinobacter caseinilyticus]